MEDIGSLAAFGFPNEVLAAWSASIPTLNQLQLDLRRTILEIVPEAEEVISYRVPAFRVSGKTIAGFAAFKNHLSYLPFSGSVIGQLPNELDRYTTTKSSVHFPIDRPLPKALVKKLIQVRLADIARRTR